MNENRPGAADRMTHILLNQISKQGSITIHDAMAVTGLDHAGIMQAVERLSEQGKPIGVINISGKAFRLYQVPNELHC